MTELSKAINEAMAKYFKPTESILPGFYAHELTAPIRLRTWRVVMNPGVFFTSNEDIELFNETQNFAGVRLWTAHFELEGMDELIDEAIANGQAERETLPDGGERVSFKSEEPLKIPGIAEASPLKVPGREAPLTFLEAALWGAVQDAEEAGDEEKAHRWFNEFYNPVQITAESEEPEELPLFTTPLDGIITAHSLTNKLIDALYQIAFMDGTQGKATITPRGGKSNEEYSVMASPAACSDYYGKRGNSELLKAIANIVHTIARDEHAGEFVAEGRVWFTAAKVARELSRTTGGTINPHQYSNVEEGTGIIPLIERGLVALSSAQFHGQKPDGTTVNLAYMCNLERRGRIMCNGEEYSNVWGVLPANPGGIGSYSEALGQSWRYPLLPSFSPLSMDEAGYKTYLEQILNELRSRLWTTDKSGNPKPSKTNSAKVTRKYKDTFRTFSPLSDLTSRQKRRVIAGLEAMLKQLALEEAKGTRREGMPLTLTATSKRDASRGRGKGEWVSFTISAKRSKGKVAIDLLGND